MKTAIMINRSVFLAGATATLALAAMSFAGSAHARDNVFWSVGMGAPGVSLNVGNAGPVYMQSQPVYVQPEPVYYQPEPVYYQPRPVYVRPAPVYVQPEPVYYGRPYGWNRRHGGQYVQAARPGYGAGYYGPGYASVSQAYYQPEGRNDRGHDGRYEDRH